MGYYSCTGEGIRVRDFLSQLCGGRGIKRFSAVLGNQTMLDHTLRRVEQLIPLQQIVVIVSEDHQAEVLQQLGDWPAENIIFQPTNRDTAAGVLFHLRISHTVIPLPQLLFSYRIILLWTKASLWIVSSES